MMAAALLVAACTPVPTDRVDADAYDTFWLWAGVKPQPVLAKARAIYILSGEVKADEPILFLPLRPEVPRIKHADIWLVVRTESLRWSPEITAQVLRQMERWQRAGSRVVGLQIDFDARTQHLDEYAGFLRQLRSQLPNRYRLSITGLLDWSANGDPSGLTALAGTIDEVVLQVYQGRHTIPGYRRYLGKLSQMPMPFRIGLVQGGEWVVPENLAKIPNFRGFVVFLLNPERAD
jgi:Protein of unknown function (DUF3142)